ncbi:lactate dehydrogenase-like oxidoreductase [Sphaerochaeta pleomorpha str. Grapes]|uniref:Lactate dehydrogenase-like oxidoreductase n=1 Tax=Sphaerochaeta pleomorpha (strain ATCC BAA-1885 / DSM 22778 / Grapes) TaxID=158190 RepID=G8QQ93_SPHPG|nr:D-2-hydroxyacid dehydrogenase [Sphaerochaeta pleomorpha]AEV28670.1 lactate dehydrogenase-like oxidoreductase [Sphaerochaeta pleomorpha str. Grapes]
MKIVVLDGFTLNPGDLSWDGLRALGEVTVYDRTKKEQIVKRIGDAEVVLTNKTPLGEVEFAACPSIQYIGVLATGFNVVDVVAAKEAGIVVTNIPTYGTTAVAQYVFALLLELCHRVGHHAQRVADGAWVTCPDFCFTDYPLIELAGKTMGIVGLGRIGHTTAVIAQAFGMKVVAFDSYQNPAWVAEGISYVTFDELLGVSDVISLHCPLTKETENLVNKETLAKMKDGVMLINTSRGPLINEDDLLAALQSGKVYGCAMDVLTVEPPTEVSALVKHPHCIVTPHIAWAPKESRLRLLNIAVENVRVFLAGEKPVNQVNK